MLLQGDAAKVPTFPRVKVSLYSKLAVFERHVKELEEDLHKL